MDLSERQCAEHACETIVAIEGRAHTLAVGDLDDELQRNEQLQNVLTQYSHALLVSSMRTTGCAGLHDVPQRCARWMLRTLDRVDGARFAVTHEFLSAVMGTTRPTISLVMQASTAAAHRHRYGAVVERAALAIHRNRLVRTRWTGRRSVH